jgi:hypothetical protein
LKAKARRAIVLLVISTFGLRSLGAILGAAFGLVVITGGLIFASPGDATEAAIGLGIIVLVLGGVLGALFGVRAARPGVRSAVLTSAFVAALAVPLGTIGVAASMSTRSGTVSVVDTFASTIAIAFVGLVFLGLPMAGLTFIVANLWVGLLRLAARRLLRSSTA